MCPYASCPASYSPHAPTNFFTCRGIGGSSMKALSFCVVMVINVVMTFAVSVAQAEDMAAMISRYRREHGLTSVRTDPQLTAIAERQAKAMAASGTMDHGVAGSFSSRMSGA